jgi:hypothetical protein
MNTLLLQTVRDESGHTLNSFNWPEFVKTEIQNGMLPDVYFAFLVKTMVDDFGSFLSHATKGAANKEQFEAQFLVNLSDFLLKKTRVSEKTS